MPRVLAGMTALFLAGCGGGAAPTPRGDVPPVLPRTSAATAAYAPWPGFGHDAAHSGSAPVVGPQRAHVRWRRRLEGPVVPGAAVGRGGVVYAASNGGVLHAIDGRTGRDRWRFDGGGTYGSDLSTVPAILPDGLVLWPGPRDSLFALGPHGRLRWRLALPAAPLSPLVDVARHRLHVADAGGGLRTYALGRGRPRLESTAHLGSNSYGSPALAADGTVYATADSALLAVNDGRVRWRVQARDIVEVSPAVAPDGTVVFGANDRRERGVTPAGRLRWTRDLGAVTYSSSAATRSGLAVVGDHLGAVTLLDARTGRLRGRLRAGSGQVWTAPAIDARHDVYVGTHRGHVLAFGPGGTLLWDLDTGASVESYPALAGDGTLLIGSESGRLYAIGP